MNEGQLTGKIIKVLPVRQGTSKNSGKEYYVGEYVVETEEDYPTKVHFTIFGEDKVKSYNLQEGDSVQIFFYVSSREYNERWYTDVRVRNIVKMAPGQTFPQTGMGGQMPQGMPPYGQAGMYGQQPYGPQAPQGMPGYSQPQQPQAPQQYGGGSQQGEDGSSNNGGVDDLPF
jgi:hypothetical protein